MIVKENKMLTKTTKRVDCVRFSVVFIIITAAEKENNNSSSQNVYIGGGSLLSLWVHDTHTQNTNERSRLSVYIWAVQRVRSS